jgi:hypothetical protein
MNPSSRPFSPAGGSQLSGETLATMGLLDRGNPNATGRSVAIHAGIWLIIAIVVCLFASIWSPLLREGWWLFLPAAAVFGAGIGALMEWQLDDGPDPENDGG